MEARGLVVKLVNAYHVKTVPGRKAEAIIWLIPPPILRSYICQRESLIEVAITHVQRMQKAHR
ncbi:hypothetical protein CLI64_28285 [Nostoc sp. CENA543]|nr:hypothetical protein CLI64_28285 [Nostoc sp. CENA543]